VKKEEIHEIARLVEALPYTNRYVKDTAFAFGPESLSLFVGEIERRTLERAAAKCDKMIYHSDEEALGTSLLCPGY